jgi:LmbE family N-acetylglucosaminyl deacetylase
MAEWLQGEERKTVLRGLDPNTIGLPDDQISVVLDTERWNTEKARAAAQHRTQLNPNSPIAGMPMEMQRAWWATESFQLATSRVGPDIVGENDLFAHIEIDTH